MTLERQDIDWAVASTGPIAYRCPVYQCLRRNGVLVEAVGYGCYRENGKAEYRQLAGESIVGITAMDPRLWTTIQTPIEFELK